MSEMHRPKHASAGRKRVGDHGGERRQDNREDRELEGDQNAREDGGSHALLGGVRSAELAARSGRDPVEILDVERSVETVARVQRPDRVGARILPQHQRSRAPQ